MKQLLKQVHKEENRVKTLKALFLIKDLYGHEPLGILSTSAILKQQGIECRAFVIVEEKNLFEKIKEFSPDLILFSSTTGMHTYYIDLCRKLKKEFNFTSIFGGSHPTFYPDIIKEDCIDIIMRGEVDEVIIDLVKRLSNGENIKDVNSVWMKDNGRIIKNEIKTYPQDLDKLPFPDRELLKDYSHLLPKGTKYFITNRGCPYECTYCFNAYNKRLAKGKYVRWRSPQNVITEIKEVKKNFGLETVNFQDDILGIDKTWLKDFLTLYKKEINLPFYCHLRPDLADEETVKILKDAGCTNVTMGLEVGNDQLRNKILKRDMSKQDIIDASMMFRKHKLRFTVQTMMCLPEETLDMVFETIDLAAKCKPDYINLYFYQPYPTTKLAEYSISKGLFDGDYDKLLNTCHAKGENEIPLDIKDKHKFKLLSDIFRVCVRMPFITNFIKLDLKYVPLNPMSRMLKLSLRGFYVMKQNQTFKRFSSKLFSIDLDANPVAS